MCSCDVYKIDIVTIEERSSVLYRTLFKKVLYGTYKDRKSVVEGKSVGYGVDLGGRRSIKKKKAELSDLRLALLVAILYTVMVFFCSVFSIFFT